MLQSTPAAGLYSVASAECRLRLPRALLSRTIPPGVGWSGQSLSVLTRFVRQPLLASGNGCREPCCRGQDDQLSMPTAGLGAADRPLGVKRRITPAAGLHTADGGRKWCPPLGFVQRTGGRKSRACRRASFCGHIQTEDHACRRASCCDPCIFAGPV